MSGLYAKLGIALVIFLFGIGAGCSMQAKRDKGKLEVADKALNAEREQVAILAATLVSIDEVTAAAKSTADARQKAGEAAGKEAEKGEVIYRDRLVYVDREIAAAAKLPTCRAQLEQTLCAVLH